MFWAQIVGVLAAGGAGSAGTVLVQGWLRRDREQALVQKLTAAANEQIYKSYSGVLQELRTEFKVTREELASARAEAQEATLRAREAESRAAGAEVRAAVAQTALRELCTLIKEQMPGAAALVAGFERIAGLAP